MSLFWFSTCHMEDWLNVHYTKMRGNKSMNIHMIRWDCIHIVNYLKGGHKKYPSSFTKGNYHSTQTNR